MLRNRSAWSQLILVFPIGNGRCLYAIPTKGEFMIVFYIWFDSISLKEAFCGMDAFMMSLNLHFQDTWINGE